MTGIERVWAEHLNAEFETKDVEATMAMNVVVVVQFRGNKIATERIYWDHAAVLRQAGLL
jgi:hypothetical protein